MLTLMFLLMMMVLFFAVVSAISRGMRRRAEWARQQARAREDETGSGSSPFAGMPFGSLLEQMMGAGGGWTRALEYDPKTGGVG